MGDIFMSGRKFIYARFSQGKTFFSVLVVFFMTAGPLWAQDYSTYYNGTSNNASVTGGGFSHQGDFTVEAWVYSTRSSHTASTCMIGRNQSSTYANGLTMDGDGDLQWVSYWDSTNNYTDTGRSIYNSWHHVAARCENVSGDQYDVTIYLDGQQVASELSSNLATNTQVMNLADIDGTDYFQGYIDEARFWSNLRSVADLQRNMFKRLTGSESGLVGYYQMSDGSGSSITDNSTTSYSMTGSFSWKNSSAFGGSLRCLVFDGTDEHVAVGTGPGTVSTVEFWVKPTSTTESFLELNGSVSISASSGTISATGFTSPTIYVNGAETSTIVSGAWQHVAVTSGTSVNASAFNLGKIGSDYFDGSLDEVRLWSDVRTAEEIRENSYYTLYGDEAGLEVYYRMDLGSGSTTTVFNTTSTSYDGTMTNMDSSSDRVSSAAFTSWYGVGNSNWFSAVNWSNGTPFWASNMGLNEQSGSLDNDPTNSGTRTITSIFIGSGQTVAITGNLTLRGNFYNNGTFTHNDNTVILDGSNLQALIGSFSLYDLTVDNAHASAEIDLDACTALTVANDLSVTDGILGISTSKADNVVDLSIGANGTLELNNDMTVSGNWDDDGTFTPNSNQVTFDGAGAQTLGGDSSTTFYDLSIDNSSDTVTLFSGITVNNSFTLDSDLNLNGQTVTLGSTATASETTGVLFGTSGTIQTTRTLSNISSEDVGGLGAVLTTTANMGSTVITRGVAAQTHGSDYGIKRYYDITPTNNTGLNATLVFNYFDSELNGLTEANLVLNKSTDGGSTWTQLAATLNTVANTLTISSLDGFSRWTAGSTDNPLLVDLIAFSAEAFEDTILLEWETASEIDNAGFNLWRIDAEVGQYTRINDFLIPAEGGATWGAAYEYEDHDVDIGMTYYYELEDIDYSGFSTFHGPVSASLGCDYDEDGYLHMACSGGNDCDDTDPAANPSATELCDGLGVDEDCDGFIDNDDPDCEPPVWAAAENAEASVHGKGGSRGSSLMNGLALLFPLGAVVWMRIFSVRRSRQPATGEGVRRRTGTPASPG